MIGLGVGIDYALFIVTRYRQGLAEGRDPRQATAVSLATSGRAVLFAGTTVIISLLGLFILQLPFMQGLAVGAIAAVVLVMLAALTLLPAMLGFSGRAIDRLHVPGLLQSAADPPTARLLVPVEPDHPAPPVAAGVAALARACLWPCPLFSMRLAFTDAGNDPTSHHHPPGLRRPGQRIRPRVQRAARHRRLGARGPEGRRRNAAGQGGGHPRRGLRHPGPVQRLGPRRGDHRLPDHLAPGGQDRGHRPHPARQRHPPGHRGHRGGGLRRRGDGRLGRRLGLPVLPAGLGHRRRDRCWPSCC